MPGVFRTELRPTDRNMLAVAKTLTILATFLFVSTLATVAQAPTVQEQAILATRECALVVDGSNPDVPVEVVEVSEGFFDGRSERTGEAHRDEGEVRILSTIEGNLRTALIIHETAHMVQPLDYEGDGHNFEWKAIFDCAASEMGVGWKLGN